MTSRVGVGVGGCFRFDIPAPAARVSAPVVRRGESLEVAAGSRALLVEDDVVGEMVATRMLEQLGFEVTAVGDRLAAAEALERTHLHAVLMDCQLPKLNFGTTRRLRELSEKSGVGGVGTQG